MREIKFRAWDKTVKKMNSITGFNYSFDKTTLFKFSLDGEYSMVGYKKDIVIMQFTGLHDKNGKEIFEGDILNSKHDKASPTGGYISSTYGFHPENAQVVSFINGEFVLDGSKNLHAELSFTEKYGGLEVIGNVCENPEYIKERL